VVEVVSGSGSGSGNGSGRLSSSPFKSSQFLFVCQASQVKKELVELFCVERPFLAGLRSVRSCAAVSDAG
jgi:hypothetical protein